MNYLTLYYKNLCEQLESQLNNLQIQLNEIRALTDAERATEEGRNRDLRAAKRLRPIAAAHNASVAAFNERIKNGLPGKDTPEGIESEKEIEKLISKGQRISTALGAVGVDVSPGESWNKMPQTVDQLGLGLTDSGKVRSTQTPIVGDTTLHAGAVDEKARERAGVRSNSYNFNERHRKSAEVNAKLSQNAQDAADRENYERYLEKQKEWGV
jgi:hypothetical protein